MVTKNDNVFDGLTYEEALLLVCDNDTVKFNKVYKECMEIINKIKEELL